MVTSIYSTLLTLFSKYNIFSYFIVGLALKVEKKIHGNSYKRPLPNCWITFCLSPVWMLDYKMELFGVAALNAKVCLQMTFINLFARAELLNMVPFHSFRSLFGVCVHSILTRWCFCFFSPSISGKHLM